MTSFAHVDHPTEHPGVVRAERLVQSIGRAAVNFDGTRAGASLLLERETITPDDFPPLRRAALVAPPAKKAAAVPA